MLISCLFFELADKAERRAASFVSARSLYECGQTWMGAAAGLALESFLTSACQTNSKKIKSCVNKDRWKGIYISAYYPSQAIFLRRLPSVQRQVSHRIKTSCPIPTRSGRSGTHNSPYYNNFIVFMRLLMVYLLHGRSSATVSSSVDLITPQAKSRHIFRLPTMNFFGSVPSWPAGYKSFNIFPTRNGACNPVASQIQPKSYKFTFSKSVVWKKTWTVNRISQTKQWTCRKFSALKVPCSAHFQIFIFCPGPQLGSLRKLIIPKNVKETFKMSKSSLFSPLFTSSFLGNSLTGQRDGLLIESNIILQNMGPLNLREKKLYNICSVMSRNVSVKTGFSRETQTCFWSVI